MPQFSLRTLLIAAAVVPVAAYGLMKATPFVASLAITVALAVWLAMALVWLECEGEPRVFARGFVVSAMFYATMWVQRSTGDQQLFTSTLTALVHELLPVEKPLLRPFHFVAESLWLMMTGLAGGCVTTWLHRQRQRANNQVTTAAASN